MSKIVPGNVQMRDHGVSGTQSVVAADCIQNAQMLVAGTGAESIAGFADGERDCTGYGGHQILQHTVSGAFGNVAMKQCIGIDEIFA